MKRELKQPPCSQPSSSDDERWDLVQRREESAGHSFFYAVRSTRIFCRPTCPSRRPRRDQVEFYRSAEEAEEAGFRACLRCHPKGLAPAQEQVEWVTQTCRWLEESSEVPSLDQLASKAGVSRFYFHRIFRKITGVTPRAYAAAHRADRVRKELGQRASVTEAIYRAGFNSSGRFYAASSKLLGMKPSGFRQGGSGSTIQFAVGECFLGSILVASTEKGICAIFLGDSPEPLVRDLQDRFPKARLIGGDRRFETLVSQVVGWVQDPGPGKCNLALDLRGTLFQQRVWKALGEIPVGTTVSYQMIAKKIGLPAAVRAVAGACAANPVAVAIPCHRVVRQDGNLSGYRWGVERKRALLLRESEIKKSR